MKFIIRLLITAAIAYGLSMILQPHIRIDSYRTAIIFSLVLGIFKRDFQANSYNTNFAHNRTHPGNFPPGHKCFDDHAC